MKIARDGVKPIIFLILCALVFAFISWIPALIIAAAALLVIWFFRDPERKANYKDGYFFAPADGKIVMNLFSVHVNRAPCTGRVDYLEYIPGKKLAAFAEKASEINERNIIVFSTQWGAVLVVQIAGLVARRIVCRLKRGDILEAGQRLGMIKLGSRVDVYLPQDVILKIKAGDKVKAGLTCLGVIAQ